MSNLLQLVEAGLGEEAGESVDAPTGERWETRLLLMPLLTPGDFATVKRQSLALDVRLTPEEWLDQLEIECALKRGAFSSLYPDEAAAAARNPPRDHFVLLQYRSAGAEHQSRRVIDLGARDIGVVLT